MKSITFCACAVLFIPSAFAANPSLDCDPPPTDEVKVKPLSIITPGGVAKIQSLVESAVTKVKCSPIKYTHGGDAKFDLEASSKEKCCDGEVEDIETIKVSGTVPFGKLEGSASFPLGPTGIVAYVKGGVSLKISGNGKLAGSCEKPHPTNICVDSVVDLSGSFEVGLAILNPDLASLGGELKSSGKATAEWCADEGVKNNQICLDVGISVNIKSVFGDVTLWNNDGEPLYHECF